MHSLSAAINRAPD